jgi:N-acetylneuraminate lyase
MLFTFSLLLATCATARAALDMGPAEYHLVDPVFTGYYPNGTVNYEIIPKYLDLSLASGVDVILLGGSTAEWPSLTAPERLKLLSEWRKAVNALPNETKKPKILFHSGDVSVANAQYLSANAENAGADWILIVAPCIMRPATIDDLVTTLGSIASQSTLPMIYYHYPALYGVDFDMNEFLQTEDIQTKLPTLAGVKYIDSDMKVLTSATGVNHSSYVFFNNDPLLAGLASGSGGAISYTTIFPYVKQMQQAYAGGNFVEAQEVQRTILEYDAVVGSFGGKPAARVLPFLFNGIDLGPPRPPLVAISDEKLAEFKATLIAKGFLKK